MSKLFKAATALSLLLTATDAKQPHVKDLHTEGAVDLFNTKKIVKDSSYGFWGYEYTKSNLDAPTADSLDFNFSVGFNLDLGVGYEALLFWILREGKNLLVLNPNVFFEVASHSYISFKLYFVEIRINLDLNGYRIAPVDY